ncbi:Asp-tRNA(Asn)/Glu-tRNA(Gln) amidotransferase GatCAB subunit A [Candidatus Poribacteria bacterium]|nr:MAG: Asp-tRNA(Asn)/Glu-tRNA(Gln) amidotransferase GatCAB subunit A [Candidatus Poribacteria bacterium]
MSETPLHYKTITELSKLISSRKLSPVELTNSILQRIDQHDERLKSYATLMADQALYSAKKAEQDIIEGNYKGHLHGIPIGVKDLCFTKGVRTMGGAKVLENHVPTYNSTVVDQLESAGAVILGKLNLTEGAMGGYHPEFDIPISPWNPDRWTGSSSSGSGVATSAGLCTVSIGSDTGGSIRFPSAACGIVGIKPTWGRVSRYGVFALAESMDHVGPMTRGVSDAAILLQTISGYDEKDPTSLPNPVPNMLDGIENEIKGIRIGFDKLYTSKDVDDELSEAVCLGVNILENLGAEIVDVELPCMDEYVLAWPTICTAEAVLAHKDTYPSRRDEYGPWFQGWLDMGAGITGAQYAEANNLRNECSGHLKRIFKDIDVLVCPSMSAPPHPVTPELLYGPKETRPARFQRFTAPFDYNGAPTLSVPCGMTKDGLPLSIQFVGKHLSEPLLCQVGFAYEQSTEWHNLHPNI